MKKCFKTNTDTHGFTTDRINTDKSYLDQSRSTTLNTAIRDLLMKFSRPVMLFDNDESNHASLINRQSCADIVTDSCENMPFYLQDQL